MSDITLSSVRICNVRGISDKTFNLGLLPNHPNIVVAPNGQGKSSFATAFKWFQQDKPEINEEDLYMQKKENRPMLTITLNMDGDIIPCTADEYNNQILKLFDVQVINLGLKPHENHIKGPTIDIINHIPQDVVLKDEFIKYDFLGRAPMCLYTEIEPILHNQDFMCNKLNLNELKLDGSADKKITDFLTAIRKEVEEFNLIRLKNAKDWNSVRKLVDGDWMPRLAVLPQVKYAMDVMYDGEVKWTARNLLRAVSLITLVNWRTKAVIARIEHLRFKQNETNMNNLFKSIGKTWKNLHPVNDGKKLYFRIDDVQRISNGERDILYFIAQLEKARYSFKDKHYILIIDEIFDYLDDANMITTQYYLSQMIQDFKKNRKNNCFFPIILTHLNPHRFYSHYLSHYKVNYLIPLAHPKAGMNILRLIEERSKLDKDGEAYQKISHYMFHFNPRYEEAELEGLMKMPNEEWTDPAQFKAYCMKALNTYLSPKGQKEQDYDALAVCIAIREMIEEYCYLKVTRLKNGKEWGEEFLKQGPTIDKIEYTKSKKVKNIPEVFGLLGMIHNNPLHLSGKGINQSKEILRQSLFSYLENQTIRHMIEEVRNLYAEIKKSKHPKEVV